MGRAGVPPAFLAVWLLCKSLYFNGTAFNPLPRLGEAKVLFLASPGEGWFSRILAGFIAKVINNK